MTFTYNRKYDSSLLRGIDDPTTPRPWNLFEEIIHYSNPQKTLLDIGCGTGFKLVHLSSYFKEITGFDISLDMLTCAKQIFKKNQINNIDLIQGNSQMLPFEKHQFDVVTCMLSRWSIEEIFRVVKPNGVVIIEDIGCEDKKEFKILFGKDKEGWRGQNLNYEKNNFLESYRQMFTQFFKKVSLCNGFWNTFYTETVILELLTCTPTIRAFHPHLDEAAIKNALEKFQTPQGIKLQQNRILICAGVLG